MSGDVEFKGLEMGDVLVSEVTSRTKWMADLVMWCRDQEFTSPHRSQKMIADLEYVASRVYRANLEHRQVLAASETGEVGPPAV